KQRKLPPEFQFVANQSQCGGPGGEEGYADTQRDQQHHARGAGFDFLHGTRQEWSPTPDIHHCAEDRSYPGPPGGHRIPQEAGKHRRECHHGDTKNQVDPEQPAEFSHMVTVIAMSVMCMAVVPGISVFFCVMVMVVVSMGVVLCISRVVVVTHSASLAHTMYSLGESSIHHPGTYRGSMPGLRCNA